MSTHLDRYRLYIDESGDHARKHLEKPTHRYLALLGVWFREDPEYLAFADALETFKRSVFGPRPDEPVILHRADIIYRHGPFSTLYDAGLRARFDAGLLDLVEQAQFTLVCVVIDKLEHFGRYDRPLHPYHDCLHEIIKRYAAWLDARGGRGDVVAEARGKVEDRRLMAAFHQIHDTGELVADRARNQRVLTSRNLKFHDKYANIPGLQLADLLAHPVKQAILAARGIVSQSDRTFGVRVAQVARNKLLRDETTGQVEGYGEVWLPK